MNAMRKPGANMSSTLLGNSTYIFLIRFFPSIVSVAALVWLSRHMAPAYYGRYQSFWVQWQVLQVVACLGIPTLMFSYPLAHLNGLIRGLQNKQVAYLGIWVMVVSIGFAMLQQYTHSPFKAWQASAFLLLSVPITIVEAYAMLGRQFQQVLLINVAYAGLFGVSHGFLVGGLLSTEQLMEWLLAGNLLRLGALAGLVWRYYQRVQPVAPVHLHTVRSFWAHTALNELIQVLFKWADKFVLNFLLPAALFALYFNGTLDVPFLPLLLGAAGSALLLQLGQPDLPDTERVAMSKAAGALLGSLVFPLFFFLLFFRYELFGVVFAHRYDAAVPLFVVSSLVIPMRAYNFTALLRHKGRGRTITTGALLDLLLAFALVYPLYRLLGLMGVALAFVVSTYCQAGYYLLHTARLLGLSWTALLPWRPWLGQIVGFGLAFLLLHEALAARFTELLVLLIGGGSLSLLLLLALARARKA
jgi:O-antigen/teichoic acid export membrane protein